MTLAISLFKYILPFHTRTQDLSSNIFQCAGGILQCALEVSYVDQWNHIGN